MYQYRIHILTINQNMELILEEEKHFYFIQFSFVQRPKLSQNVQFSADSGIYVAKK